MDHWLVLVVTVVSLLVLDIFSHKGTKPVTLNGAMTWSALYLAAGLGFGLYIYAYISPTAASAYWTGYVLEKMLSVDNLVVFALVFGQFGIPVIFQRRVLYYGILGAAVMRLLFLTLGLEVIHLVGFWALFGFGVIILWSVPPLLKEESANKAVDYKSAWYTQLIEKVWPVHPGLVGDKFFYQGRITPLFICLVAIELTDVMFAFDSVPAVLAVTKDQYIAFAAMMFAILGLRSMYFLLAFAKDTLRYLNFAVAMTLTFVGMKLIFEAFGYEVDPVLSLSIVTCLLGGGIIASLLFPKKEY